jgi:hypothetical protein
MIDILLGDRDFTPAHVKAVVWQGDDNRFATFDLAALAKEVGTLRTQLAAARAVTDAMVERASEAYVDAIMESEYPLTSFCSTRAICAALIAALSEAP